MIEFFGIEEDGFFTNLVATVYGKEKFVLAQVNGHFSKESLQKIDVDIEQGLLPLRDQRKLY